MITLLTDWLTDLHLYSVIVLQTDRVTNLHLYSVIVTDDWICNYTITDWLTNCDNMTDWLTNFVITLLVDWMTNCMITWVTEWLCMWNLTDWLLCTNWLSECLIEQLTMHLPTDFNFKFLKFFVHCAFPHYVFCTFKVSWIPNIITFMSVIAACFLLIK